MHINVYKGPSWREKPSNDIDQYHIRRFIKWLVNLVRLASSCLFSFLSSFHVRSMKLSPAGKLPTPRSLRIVKMSLHKCNQTLLFWESRFRGSTLKSLRTVKMSLHKCNKTLLCWRIKVSLRFTNGVKVCCLISKLSTEAGAIGVLGQNVAWRVELDCGHVKGNVIHLNQGMGECRVTRQSECNRDSVGKPLAEVCQASHVW